MSRNSIYNIIGLIENPFPVSGVTPASKPGKLKYLEPYGIADIKESVLNDFGRHLESEGAAGYSFNGKYGQGKSLVLHHFIDLFLKEKEKPIYKNRKIVISYIRGRDIAPLYRDNSLPRDILSAIIQSFNRNFETLEDNVKDEFFNIQTDRLSDKTHKFNDIMDENNIERIFVFIDEVEDISMFDDVIESLKDLIDIVDHLSILLFCTTIAWTEVLLKSKALTQGDTGIGRYKRYILPEFNFDIAIKSVNTMLEKATIPGTDFTNPFTKGLIRTICLISQFDGRIFNIICNLLLHNYVEDLNLNETRKRRILPEEFLSKPVLNHTKITDDYSPIFDFILYERILDSFQTELEKKIFNLFLTYYENFNIQEVVEYLDNPDRNDLMRFIYSASTDVIERNMSVLNSIYDINISLIQTQIDFDALFVGQWSADNVDKKEHGINVISFHNLSYKNLKDIFTLGNDYYCITLKNIEDLVIMINSSGKNVNFDVNKAKRFIEFLENNNLVDSTTTRSSQNERFRISEHIIYKVFRRYTPIGTDPWKAIPDVDVRETVYRWYEDNHNEDDLFLTTWEGVYYLFKEFENNKRLNYKIADYDHCSYECDGFYYLKILYSNDYIEKSDFFIAYISDDISKLEEFIAHFEDILEIPNCFLFLIDDEPHVLTSFNTYLLDRIFKDNTNIQDRIIFLQLRDVSRAALFLLGLYKDDDSQQKVAGTEINFRDAEQILIPILKQLENRFENSLNEWKSHQIRNGLYLKALNHINEDRFIGGLLPCLQIFYLSIIERGVEQLDLTMEEENLITNEITIYKIKNYYGKGRLVQYGTMFNHLQNASELGVIKREESVFSKNISKIEQYIVNLLIIEDGSINYNTLMRLFNFENQFNDLALKYHLATLAFKGVISIFTPNPNPVEIIIWKSSFLNKDFSTIRLNKPEEMISRKKDEIWNRIGEITQLKLKNCSHDINIENYIDSEDNDLEDLVTRQKNTLEKFKTIFEKTLDVVWDDTLFTQYIERFLVLDLPNIKQYLMKYPGLYWALYYLNEDTQEVYNVLYDAYTKCKEEHEKINSLEEKLTEIENKFQDSEKRYIELIDEIENKKITDGE